MAKWSPIWDTHTGVHRVVKLYCARNMAPLKAKPKKTGGQYPHLQPFFRNRPQKEKAAA